MPSLASVPPVDLCVKISSPSDLPIARQLGRQLALELGLGETEVTLLAAAITEVARNIIDHAAHGELFFNVLEKEATRGLQIIARDEGPGIPDVHRAMQYGFSTVGSLGVGLPGAKWLVDEFTIDSTVGHGTRVVLRKWAKAPAI